jgi:plastocyanin
MNMKARPIFIVAAAMLVGILALQVTAGAVVDNQMSTENHTSRQVSTDNSTSKQSTPEQTQSPDSSGQAAPDQSTAAVNIKNHAFDPAQLNVAKGTTVTWTNADTEAHTVTADDGLFDSGVLEPGQSYSVWLGGSGTVAYHCELHPDMKGSVVVG